MSKFAALALPVEQPARMIIHHPVTQKPLCDEAGKQAFIDVWSADSETRRKFERASANRRLARRARAKITAEEIEAEQVALLVALTAGWHLVDLNGRAIEEPFTPDNARELYAEPAMAWLREQVDEFASDRANFAKASSTT